jgi:HK97 family phage major capsid protein
MTTAGYIMSPRVALFLEALRDGNGNKAFPEMAEGRLGIYPFMTTTSVPDNLGAGTESEVYFGDFAQFMIGDTEQIMLAASDVAAYDDAGTTATLVNSVLDVARSSQVPPAKSQPIIEDAVAGLNRIVEGWKGFVAAHAGIA